MINNIKCPFCGTELESRKLLTGMVDYVCTNNQCDFSYMPLTAKWWQALIDGKAAQDKLHEIQNFIEWKQTLEDNGRAVDWAKVAKYMLENMLSFAPNAEEDDKE